MRFVTLSTASTPILPLRMSLPRRISRFETHLDPPTEIGFLGLIVVARPKRRPQWAKRLHIRLTGSRAVTNRHTSDSTSCFEIEWDILEGQERSWGLGFGSFFFVFGCLFCVSVSLPVFWLHNLVLHKPFVCYQNSK
jgi:hypothetical protein